MNHCHDINAEAMQHATGPQKVLDEHLVQENMLLHPSLNICFAIGTYEHVVGYLALCQDTSEKLYNPSYAPMYHVLPVRHPLGPAPPIVITSCDIEDGPDSSAVDIDSDFLSDVSDMTDLSLSDLGEEDAKDMEALFDDMQTSWHPQDADIDESLPFLLQRAYQVFDYYSSTSTCEIEDANQDSYDATIYLFSTDGFLSQCTTDGTGLELLSSGTIGAYEI
ncbi:hypothetical protein SERLADRAFT_439063 [Serpula lacrymans var. lacrymans S7.9]|uniref:Uncharacterized protein n=1 Tax=Serpula lacrymans var. lacrymans (strain S7.9) TaxID=578457 RepID=F8NYT4_SERL9|nr:uncharacterized protein SERLADRAFT_439063 [Serpula lacrymans var. lacrymans S7.9]EGO23755.1 hypothetical protein SERLADRAFT_439063 [Serpula lacrymans var. lacrymans S7.9]